MHRLFACTAGALLLGIMPFALAENAKLATEIRWTTFGIPHIRAADERGIGYGIGYAYARDNLCLLADEIVTARGERAKFFGASGQSSTPLDNIPSDIFFRWLNENSSLQNLWQAQPVAVQQRLEGYAAGFNRYLRDLPREQQPEACAGKAWLRPISTHDLLSLVRRLMVEGGLGRFVEAMVGAAPPEAEDAQVQYRPPLPSGAAALNARLEAFSQTHGSNAIALGSQLSDNSKGQLLANPHFPWNGALRFYQMHLSIPGQLDVMGAALPGLPVVNIGFNAQLAWTHTVDTSLHFTLHRLTLDPKDAHYYLIDGQRYPLEKRLIRLEVQGEDGQVSTLEHELYLSIFGPLVVWPEVLDWTDHSAYALQDANLNNPRALQQWMTLNSADSLEKFRQHIEQLQGIPWVNTLAASAQGKALFLNHSVVPNLSPEQLTSCLDPELLSQKLPVLDGSRTACNWTQDPKAAQAGIVPATQLPSLERDDFVQNSNDSAWLSNPSAPLTGFSPLVSRQGTALKPRTRFALSQLPHWKPGSVTPRTLEQLVTDNRVALADALMDDLLSLCHAQKTALTACNIFKKWNRRAGLDDGLGPLYFQYFINHFQNINDPWRVPFDPKNPVNTPKGIALDNPSIVEQVQQALLNAAEDISEAGLDKATGWGALQVASRGTELIPIPGASGHLGVYNAIESQADGNGHLEVASGSSYLQRVRFDKDGPQAQGLLSFSQSSDPASPHAKDQTLLFSRQQWPVLPFTEAQIQGASPSAVLSLSE